MSALRERTTRPTGGNHSVAAGSQHAERSAGHQTQSMREHNLKQLAGDPNLISGIYNYCDRWCERCAFALRCLLSATGQADDPELRDLSNEEFGQTLRNIFRDTGPDLMNRASEFVS